MKFTFLEIEANTLLIYLLVALISLVIFYFLIKAAVRNGMIEANAEIKNSSIAFKTKPENKPTTEQEKLKERYDKGEITFEEYQKQWKVFR